MTQKWCDFFSTNKVCLTLVGEKLDAFVKTNIGFHVELFCLEIFLYLLQYLLIGINMTSIVLSSKSNTKGYKLWDKIYIILWEIFVIVL